MSSHRYRCFWLFFLAVMSLLQGVSSSTSLAEDDFVWQEAENFSSTNLSEDDYWTGSERAPLLSGDKLVAAVFKAEAAKNRPEGGYVLQYELNVPQNDTYDLWMRVGMEWIRAPFEWRIDDGPWHEAPADKPTTNVMELERYNEIAWLDVGRVKLKQGGHNLTVRYDRVQPDRNDLWISLDCFAFVPSSRNWTPEGDLKPGGRYENRIDRQAANKLYRLPEPDGGGSRSSVELSGLWQVARWDDTNMDEAPRQPETQLPDLDKLRWRGVEVPKSQWNVDGLNLAHRTVYRTRVKVPGGYEDRGFKLHFSGTNWLVSVFVNGKLAGTHRGVWIPWDMDISNFVVSGEVNEIALAIKGPWYAIDYENYKGGTSLTRQRNIPIQNARGVRWVAPIYPSTKGDGDGRHYGIVNPVTMIAAGEAYTADVFVQPHGVQNRSKRLTVDVTLRNTTHSERTLTVACEAVYDETGEVEKTLEPVEVTVPAGETVTQTVETRDWHDAKFWWPGPDPHLYWLRTTISANDRTLDVHNQLFGYRWVEARDRGIYLNGRRYNIWNWVGVKGRPQTAEQWLGRFRQEKNRFTRFSANRKTTNFLDSREERLEFYDRHGIPGRLCSMIDGMFISYHLGQKKRDEATGERFIAPNGPLWEAWKRHIRQLTKAYRNHPSVLVYQVENELVYINGMNLGYPLDSLEKLMGEMVQAGRDNDQTRPYSVGGAGDLDCRCEINAPHYPLGELDWYPENAYTLEKIKEKLQRYPPFHNDKPWTVGESLFAHHLRYGTLALGDEAFRSARDAARGKARFLRHVYEGYRYGGAAGFYPWDNLSEFDDGRKMFSALAAIPRKRTHRLYGGRTNELVFKVMNDTLKQEPLEFEWSYEAGGEIIAEGSDTARIKCGHGRRYRLTIDVPATDERLDGTLTVRVRQPGAESTENYVDRRSIPVLPRVDELDVDGRVLLLDSSGRVADFLDAAGRDYQEVDDLSETDGRSGLLIVGPNALSPEDAFGRSLLRFADRGGRVVVLEQENPVAGANLPAPLSTTTHYGGYAHPQALGTPVFRDLGADDLIDWAGSHPTYVKPYEKPSKGGRSLAECGAMLERSPLVEMPTGRGVIVLCQMRVGSKLGVDPAADILLRNLAEHYASYRPPKGIAGLYAPNNRLLREGLRETGVQAEQVGSVRGALNPEEFKVAVIHASRSNLKVLNGMTSRVKRFQQAGGWIMLAGLTPAGIDEYNRLLGTDHLIRPFRMERVTLERPGYPLAATMGNRDVTMYSPENLQHTKNWISRNVYSYCVDAHRNAAPFTRPPGAPEDILQYESTRDDHDPYNYVNDLLNSDHWRYIRQIWIDKGQESKSLTFRFRKPETISKVRIWNNANYSTIKDLSIIFDGEEPGTVRTALADSGDLTEVMLDRPRRVEESITLRIESWRPHRPRDGGYLVGIDNVEFIRAGQPEDRACLDNVGGLVAYPRGRGGFFLNQIKFMQDEPRPVNADKKLNITGTLLRNMGIGSGTSAVAVPGVNVRYEPISLLDHCNQFLAGSEKRSGWFGEDGHDMRLLTTGERRLQDDVLYDLVDHATAPVPNCIMLGVWKSPEGLSRRVTGIDVGKKSDLLFFLHTADVHHPVSPAQRERIGASKRPYELPEVLRYVVHYADGEKVEIPVILEKHIDHWLRQNPRPLPQAQVAATVEVPGLEDRDQDVLQDLVYRMNTHRVANLPELNAEDLRGVLYGMQVKNPRPDVKIESIDLVPGEDDRTAVPAVLGITLGDVVE